MGESSGGTSGRKGSLMNLLTEKEKEEIMRRAENFQFEPIEENENMNFTYTLGQTSVIMPTGHNVKSTGIIHKRSADGETHNSPQGKKIKDKHVLMNKHLSQSGNINNAIPRRSFILHSNNTNRFEIFNKLRLNDEEKENVFNARNDNIIHENSINDAKDKTNKKSDSENSMRNRTSKIKFCPPIFVSVMSVKTLHDYIKKNFDKDLKVKFFSQSEGRFKVSVDNSDVHSKLIQQFRENGVNAYSFTPRDKKKTTILLKGVNCDFTTDEIKDNILQLVPELKIFKVASFTTGYSKNKNRKLNMFLVQLEPGEETKKLIDIKYLLFQRVYWEKLYKTDIVRCYRC